MSAPGYGEEMAAVFSSNGGVASVRWRGSQFIPCLSLQYFFWRESTKRRFFDPTCVSLRDPLPEKSVARLHSHTPCPLYLDWFSVRILEGITAICRLLRNKGGSSLSSLQYFRGITWPDKHAFAPLYTCSLFCPDPSTQPNCPLYFQADHVFLSHLYSPLWIGSTLYSSVFTNCLPQKENCESLPHKKLLEGFGLVFSKPENEN